MSSIIYLCVVFLDDIDLNFLRQNYAITHQCYHSQDAQGLGNVCKCLKVISNEFSR